MSTAAYPVHQTEFGQGGDPGHGFCAMVQDVIFILSIFREVKLRAGDLGKRIPDNLPVGIHNLLRAVKSRVKIPRAYVLIGHDLFSDAVR